MQEPLLIFPTDNELNHNISYLPWAQLGYIPQNDRQKSLYFKPNIKNINANIFLYHILASPGLEPETFSVLDWCDNHLHIET